MGIEAFFASWREPGQKFDQIHEVYSSKVQAAAFAEEEKFAPKVLPQRYLTDPQPGHAFVYVTAIQRIAMHVRGRISTSYSIFVFRVLAFLTASALALVARAAPAPDSEAQAVLDIRAAYEDANPRPTHVTPPLQGSFGQLAAPHLLALQKSYDQFAFDTPEQSALRKSVFAGARPLSDLPPRWMKALEANRADVDGLLRATHAATGRLPRPLTLFGMFSEQKQPYTMLPAQFAVKLASIEVLQAVQTHSPRATAICLDELALARDLSHGSLIGQMIATTIVTLAEPTCALAVRAATPAGRADFRRELATIRSGWTPMATTFRQEAAFFDLMCFDQLSTETQKQIPSGARLYFANRQKSTWMDSARLGLFGGWARRSHIRNLRELEAAMAQAPSASDPVVERLSRDTPVAMRLAFGGVDAPSDWLGFVRRARVAQARLEMLDAEAAVLDAHDRSGSWPSSWGEVGIEPPVDPRSGRVMRLVPESSGVLIQPVSDGARTDDDLGAWLR